MKRTKTNIKDPLFRFFEREINLGEALLRNVRQDLQEILAVCSGTQKQSNHIRALTSALNKSQIPVSWLRYTIPKSATSVEWMTDFAKRIQQLLRLTFTADLRTEEIWLGGMFAPEAYITATRQLIAQTNGWSLEQLHMHLKVGEKDPNSMNTFSVNGKSLFLFKGKEL